MTQRLSSAVVRRGTVELEGQTANVLIVQENNGQAGLVYMAAPSGDILTASGTAFGAAPNGAFTYTGTHIIAERSVGGGAHKMALSHYRQTLTIKRSATMERQPALHLQAVVQSILFEAEYQVIICLQM